MVEDPGEILGKHDLFFKVYVKNATGLPKHLSCNPFVTYQFRFEKDKIYQTDEFQGVNQNPSFNYEYQHCIDEVTPLVVEELRKGSISFMVYAYPPNQLDTMAQNDGGEAIKRRMTLRGGEDVTKEIDHTRQSQILGLDNTSDPDAAPQTGVTAAGGKSPDRMARKLSMK